MRAYIDTLHNGDTVIAFRADGAVAFFGYGFFNFGKLVDLSKLERELWPHHWEIGPAPSGCSPWRPTDARDAHQNALRLAVRSARKVGRTKNYAPRIPLPSHFQSDFRASYVIDDVEKISGIEWVDRNTFTAAVWKLDENAAG